VLDASTFLPLRPLSGASVSSGLALAWSRESKEAHVVEAHEPSRLGVTWPAGLPSTTGLSPDGAWVVAEMYDASRPEAQRNVIDVLSTHGGASHEIVAPTKYLPTGIAVTSDGAFLAGLWPQAMGALELVAWDLATGKRSPGHTLADGLLVSPLGHTAVLVDPGVRTVDLATGQIGDTYELPTRRARAALSPDGKKLAVGSEGTWTVLLDLASGASRVLEDSVDAEPEVFSSDGALLYARHPAGIGAWRAADGAALFHVIPLGPATALLGRDGRVELLGDARAGAEILACAVGARTYPLSRCGEAVRVDGVVERAMNRPLHGR